MLRHVVWRSCFAGCFMALWTCSPRISSHPWGEQLRVRQMLAVSAASVMLWCAANNLLFFAWVTGRHLCLIKQIKDNEIIQETSLWWGIRIDLLFSAAAQAERRKHRRARFCQFSFQFQVRIAAGTVKHGQLIRSLHERICFIIQGGLLSSQNLSSLFQDKTWLLTQNLQLFNFPCLDWAQKCTSGTKKWAIADYDGKLRIQKLI